VKSVIEVKDSETFRKLLKSKLPVVVDFWASWCGPCLAMGPVFGKFSAKHTGKALFVKVNTDELPRISKEIEFIPTFIVYRNGKQVGRIVGGRPTEEFQKKMNSLLSKTKSGRQTKRRMERQDRPFDQYATVPWYATGAARVGERPLGRRKHVQASFSGDSERFRSVK
jgi:thioredoxin